MRCKSFLSVLFILFSVVVFTACAQNPDRLEVIQPKLLKASSNAVATFGAGCFWCVEAQFALLKGVDTVISGYSGGSIEHPSYAQVSSGRTGHAEVVQVQYDSTQITYDELLEAFFVFHDPTQINRQGHDIGTQYRSIIFTHSELQKHKAIYYIHKLEEEGVFAKPLATKVERFEAFYAAEDYHQQYYLNNQNAPYCSMVIQPKVEQIRELFKDKLKSSSAGK